MEKDKTYRIVNKDGIANVGKYRPTLMKFKTKDELLCFLHGKFEFPYCGHREGIDNLRQRNKILSRCCHNWNDKFYTIETTWIDGVAHYNYVTHYFDYMILDPYDRIMSINDLVEESFHFTKDVDIDWPKRYYNDFKYESWERYKKRSPVYGHYGYYRQVSVQQERRKSLDPMHKPYVRCKRNNMALEPYNIESTPCSQSGWKIMKLRKQWMENNDFKTKKKNYRSIKL